MNSDFNILNRKIKAFRKKYTLYQVLRGLMMTILLFIGAWLLLNFLEYKLYMPSRWRKILFLTNLLFFGLVFLRYVIYPAMQFLGMVNVLNRRKISEIIRQYIPGVKDKLLNIIELHDNFEPAYSREITEAAISQKINDLRFIDFSGAVRMKNLLTLFNYLILSFFIVISLYFIDSSVITGPGNRIIHFNREFVKPSPYEFVLLNNGLIVKKGENFIVKVECRGKNIPSIVFINIGGNNFVMKYTGNNRFEYELSSVLRSVGFYFTDLVFNSVNYELKVIPIPVINEFSVEINPPAYTGLPGMKLENIGDLKIAAGSLVTWNFNCFDTDSLIIRIKEGTFYQGEKINDRNFTVTGQFKKPTEYEVLVRNLKTEFESVMNFVISVTEDYFPEIKVLRTEDSVRMTRFYFKGSIFDDYGFSGLKFHLNIEAEDSSFSIPFVPLLNNQDFYYTVDFKDYIKIGDRMDYYFSVTDNDQVNGPKTTTSDSFVFLFPDQGMIGGKQKEEFENIEKLIGESQKMVREIKNDFLELQKKNMDNKFSDWERNQLVEDVVNKKNILESILDEIEKRNRKFNNYQNTFNEVSDEILKKQEQIQDLLEDVMTDELRKLLEEFSKLAEDFNSKMLNELSKKMHFSFEDLSKQLDRNMEMLKKIKIEQELEQIVNRVELLQEKEEQLANEVMEKNDFDSGIKNEENNILEIEDIQQELSGILDRNNELEKPYLFDDFKEEFREIKDNMNNSLLELGKKNKRRSSESMKETGKKLGNLAFAMQRMIDSNQMEENSENIQNLKQILKNLVLFSIRQEEVLSGVKATGDGDPVMREFSREQRKLVEQSQVIKDSIYALGERTAAFGNVVNNELLALEINLVRSVELMGEGFYKQAGVNQQLVMTAVNNLALILSDALMQMEEQMAEGKAGDQNCRKGKGGGMGSLKQQSENLRNQLEKMIEQMKKGDSGKMSREMAQSLMEHEMMQQMLRDLMNNGNIGDDARKQLQQVDQFLEQNRREIMNKRIGQNLVHRQNQIFTRLLEAEKSEMERDQENKRESNTADKTFYSNPVLFFEMNQERTITLENFQRNSLKLNNFYQDKFKNYLEKFNSHATFPNGN